MAISLAALVGLGGAAFGQQPPPTGSESVAPLATTKWVPYEQAVVVPPAPVSRAKLPPAPVAPVSTQPGLVPKTLTFQKEAGDIAPATPLKPVTFQKVAGETAPVPAAKPVAPGEIVQPASLPPLDTVRPPAAMPPLTSSVTVPPLYFQKEAEKAPAKATPAVGKPLPPLGVPAIPTALVRVPQAPKEDETTRKEVPKAPDRQPELTKGTLPTRENVFRLTSDTDLNARMQQELGNRKDPFPAPAPLSTEPLVYQPKTLTYPPMQAQREPNYVVHRRLYFEEKNSERAGWEVGFLQPFLSTAYFYKDVVFLPHKVASGLWKNRWDTSAGKCPPGAATPYYLYPPGFTVSGLMLESTLITGLVFIFP